MKVGIIGCGTMGSGIAQVAATANCSVKIYDTNAEQLVKSEQKLEKILNRLIEKGRINDSIKSKIQKNITYSNALEDLHDSDMVIEAIVENWEIKREVFKKLETLVSTACILASNTSSLSITSIASVCQYPERFIGIHFFNPAPLMKLVEIVPAVQTAYNTINLAQSTISNWGKLTVMAKDTPGFIVNKVARPFYSESLRIFEEGIVGKSKDVSIATIDWALQEFGGFRMGPFTLMDFIGNDVNYIVTETVFKSFYFDPRYKPSFTQKRLAEAGYLGKKSGRGFYNYSDPNPPEPFKDKALGRQIADRVVLMLINEAADTLHLNIATMKDIDTAMTKGVNYPKGLFQWADEIGIDKCVKELDKLYNFYHEDRYRCSALLRNMAAQKSTFYSNV